MHSPLTEHARARMQQRGITPAALDLLLDYGHEAQNAVIAEDDAIVTVGHHIGRLPR